MSDIDDFIKSFESLGDWEQRYLYLAELGERLPAMPVDLCTEANRVKPCMSKVWVWAFEDESNPGRIRFHGECDTAIIKGVVAVLIRLCSGKTPTQVVDLDFDRLFEGLQLAEHLSPNRHVGVYAIVDVMKAQAQRLATELA